MKVFFNQLFDYNFYCNKQLIEAYAAMEEVAEVPVWRFSHILNAHHRWNAVLTGKEPEFEIFQLHEVKQWADIHYENQRASFEIITNTADFEKRFDYLNSEGRSFTNTVQDILFHMINHSTHHRGQLAVDFRTDGKEPIPLDYILYKRS